MGTMVPVRGLAEKGVLRDPSPYQLDLNAFSNAWNVRFHANQAERAPVFRTVQAGLVKEPVFIAALNSTTSYDSLFIAAADFTVQSWISGALTNITSPSSPGTTSNKAITSTFLGDVIYMNRPDQAPMYYGPSSTTLATMPNMETSWTARSVRAFGDYLIALNVTKPPSYTTSTGITLTGGALINLFKWSDLTLNGLTPDSWDPFDPTKSAGENPLEELDTGIVDGATLRGIFVVYSENQIWGVTQTGTAQIFDFAKLFDEGGLIAPNCVVEINGMHFVFGVDDIYKHDGVEKVSIIDKRNRDALFRYLNKGLSEVCFVHYSRAKNSIVFGYNSVDPGASFQGADRCNVGAVYDITADTWSFIDLPNVSGMAEGSIDSILTWATCPAGLTWDTVGSSWADQGNTFVKNTVAVSATFTGSNLSVTSNRIAAWDFFDGGAESVVIFQYEPELNPPVVLERTGLALDQMGSDLATYKKVRAVYPMLSVSEGTILDIQVGGALTPTGAPVYLSQVSFDPTSQYKIDGIQGGRYLAVKFTLDGPGDFQIAGFDLDITNGGRR